MSLCAPATEWSPFELLGRIVRTQVRESRLFAGSVFERMQVSEPENVDVEAVRVMLRRMCSSSVVGAVCGRARLRDALSRQLGCPARLIDQILDTMIARGLLCQQVHPDGWVYWAVR